MEHDAKANFVIQAGFVVSAPLQVLIDRLATYAVKEISLLLGADGEFKKLQRTLERIRAMAGRVEENASLFSNNISSEAWKVWLEDVEALCYSADDLLDDISLDLSKHIANLSTDASPRKPRNMLISSFKWNVPHEIGGIREGLEKISTEMDSLYKTEFTKLGQCRPSYHAYPCPSSSLVNEMCVFGRELERDEIVEMLLDDDECVSVVPIVGMGGLGKTAIAQLIYTDDRLENRFDLKLWAHVSMDFDVTRISKSIIESVSGKNCKSSNLDVIQLKLQNLISEKKFLLVLDDYWSEKYRDWDLLFSPFRFGSNGSKILVTTRSRISSRIVGTVPPHCLKLLTDENCWEIIKQRAMPNKNLKCKLEQVGRKTDKTEECKGWELEQVGREIARKCKGLPLAAKTLGSMLHFKSHLTDWISILNSDMWELRRDDNDIFPTLALSYYDLPAQLKRCFSYCSMFPKNYDFKMNELVSLWIAEGFVRPTKNVQIQDLGNEYFENLVWRCFFEKSSLDNRGLKIYKMHDLVHSMAQLISDRTCLHVDEKQLDEDCTVSKSSRHMSLFCRGQRSRALKGYLWYENLRTLKVISDPIGNIGIPYELFLKLKSLKVLDLSGLGLTELPDSIEYMKRLRNLNLSDNNFERLPPSLTCLFGLQILNLELCLQLRCLPINMKEMVSLEHLHCDIIRLESMPPEFGRLVNLQTLSAFIVGKTEGCGIKELKNMKFLRGCLRIKNLENVLNLKDAKGAMLDMKPFLDRLELEWNGGAGNNDAEILAGLRPHENVKELLMINYNDALLPSWLVDPYGKLSNINLQSCRHYHIISPLGRLQHLKSLLIEDMRGWTNVGDYFSGFISLESLTIKNIPDLTSWDLFTGSRFPQLRSLHVVDCPILTNLPSLVDTSFLQCVNITLCPQILSLPDDGLPTSLEELVILDSDIIACRCKDADWHKIQSIKTIVIDCQKVIDWELDMT